MKTIRLLFLGALTLSAGCGYEEPPLSFVETVNLGTQITFANGIGCTQFALTHVTDNKLIIGVEQPKFIDLNAKTVTDIAFNAEGVLIYVHPQVKATETHLWSMYYLQNTFQIKVSDISTGIETLLVDNLAGAYGGPASYNSVEYAVNDDNILYNKAKVTGIDSAIHQKKLHDNNAPEIVLPIKGTPVSLSQSGNLIIYRTQKGYHQYDLVSQQSLFLSPFDVGNDNVVSTVFFAEDKPYIIYGHYAIGHPVYIRDVSNNDETVISDTGSNGGIMLIKISPDAQHLSFWAHQQVLETDGVDYYDAYELVLYDFEAQETELIYRVERHGHGFVSCYGTPDFNADFSPDSQRLTYIFNGSLYQFSLNN